MKNLFVASIVIASVIMSCGEDDFVKYVEVDQEISEPKLVLLANFESQNDRHELVVSNSLDYNDLEEYEGLKVDNIVLKTPDQGDIIPRYIENVLGGASYVIEGYTFLADTEYVIEVSHQDFPTLVARTISPDEVIVNDISVDTMSLGDWRREDQFRISFNDVDEERNFFQFSGSYLSLTTQGDSCTEPYYFDFIEEELSSEEDWISDLSFNGGSKTIELTGNQYCPTSFDRHSFKINILSIPESYVDYLRSVDLAYESEDNPFVEPTTLYTNVEGGYGIFTIATASTVEGFF